MAADAPARDPRAAAARVKLELADLQGNILTAYGRLGFPRARALLLNVRDAAAGRAFIEKYRSRVTTALRWDSRRDATLPVGRVRVERPQVTINFAFTFRGLYALGVPTRTLRALPDDFLDGMAARCAILGDDIPTNMKSNWDSVWLFETEQARPHILVTLNAQMLPDGGAIPALDVLTREIVDDIAGSEGKIALLSGHRGGETNWQEMRALLKPAPGGGMAPCPKEHFGFTDAISDPVFEGQFPDDAADARATGNGAIDGAGTWRPLATGEFLLGWPDEAQEVPGASLPLDFSRNGTFMAYRKLHQHVAEFDTWIEATARQFAGAWGIAEPEVARETLRAKLAGRWSDGVPLTAAPTHADWIEFNRLFPEQGDLGGRSERGIRLVDIRFRDHRKGFRDDRDGFACPVGAHTRRMNTRDTLDPVADDPDPTARMGSALNNRRRILRRGLPYGHADAPDDEHGIVMMAVCANLSRQFEFVQQQWANYGLDFNVGNDTCPMIGNHGPDAKFVIAADPTSGNPPFIASRLPQFVSTRGGDYFFVPSMTALRMIGMGVVDPT